MQAMLAGLVDELRNVGIEVSVGEHADAARALTQVSLKDKETVRAALGCALIKDAGQLAAFHLIFDLCTSGSAQPGAELAAAMTDQELADTLRAAIATGDAHLRRLLADEYVRRFGGLEPGSAVAGVFAMIAVEEAAGLAGLRDELAEGAGTQGRRRRRGWRGPRRWRGIRLGLERPERARRQARRREGGPRGGGVPRRAAGGRAARARRRSGCPGRPRDHAGGPGAGHRDRDRLGDRA